MGKILFTKQEAVKEGDKIFVNISQKIEYEQENVTNVVADLKQQLEQGKEFLKQFDAFEIKSVENVTKTFDANMAMIKSELAMSEEELKQKLYDGMMKHKDKMLKSLEHEKETKELTIQKEKDRLVEMKKAIVNELKALEQAIDMYNNALN